MFETYLRDKKRIYRSFWTEEKARAMLEFDALVYRRDLDGMKIVAILEYKKSVLLFHRFDVQRDHPRYLRGITLKAYKEIGLI
ncbi:hypothetical protein SAMN05216339_1228 [Nitrosomonas eutropha]|uniref:Uncharacterized protein n=1 Tax=Nitrosomonas eutropha TaxID=916 RepID=A0A1I7JDR1_9PROT|nr:hypothetical protein [Nitrosomonas eutropha]SFU83292.1 hypothetical protein SAMN05216339_1228 [Nitrosomonas eutropha]